MVINRVVCFQGQGAPQHIITMATCFPDTCFEGDVSAALLQALPADHSHPNNNTNSSKFKVDVHCQKGNTPTWGAKEIIAM